MRPHIHELDGFILALQETLLYLNHFILPVLILEIVSKRLFLKLGSLRIISVGSFTTVLFRFKTNCVKTSETVVLCSSAYDLMYSIRSSSSVIFTLPLCIINTSFTLYAYYTPNYF